MLNNALQGVINLISARCLEDRTIVVVLLSKRGPVQLLGQRI
jgi:hypothetical protein